MNSIKQLEQEAERRRLQDRKEVWKVYWLGVLTASLIFGLTVFSRF